MKAFEIDFVRQAIEQTLLQEHIKNHYYLGGEEQVKLFSFYEHLQTDEEVDRYVETVRDLNNQQNRTGLLANGTILAPTNPTITNLNQCTIIPMEFSINFRCTLADRDTLKETLNNMVTLLKGRKVDIAEFNTGKLFIVGTLGNNSIGQPLIKVGDYIGEKPSGITLNAWLTTASTGVFAKLTNDGFIWENFGTRTQYLYYGDNGVLKVARYDNSDTTWKETNDNGTYNDIIFPPTHTSFTKWKMSMSFDSFRCSEPRTLNAEDYCDLSFGGSATLVSLGVTLGNDLTKLAMRRYKLISSDNNENNTTYTDTDTWVEPLELPSANDVETRINQLTSNNFINNTHSNSITLSNQYTFIVDKSINLLKQLFYYARYGTQTFIRPNIIYKITELWSSWGEYELIPFNAKIIESIDIENNESDVLTITLPLQTQGDNY